MWATSISGALNGTSTNPDLRRDGAVGPLRVLGDGTGRMKVLP